MPEHRFTAPQAGWYDLSGIGDPKYLGDQLPDGPGCVLHLGEGEAVTLRSTFDVLYMDDPAPRP